MNLVSLAKAAQHGAESRFANNDCFIGHDKHETRATKNESNMEVLEAFIMATQGSALEAEVKTAPFDIWHQRLGHLSKNSAQSVLASRGITEIEPTTITCEACATGKMAR